MPKKSRSSKSTRRRQKKVTRPKGILAEVSGLSPKALSGITPTLQNVLDDVAYRWCVWKPDTFGDLALGLAGAVWTEKRRRGVR